ncbi:MAG TPA: DUF481 domain-containing protein [Myxococcota bacterium]|nr:DUF481 domain-containing protein [Myxococcota bacterium]
MILVLSLLAHAEEPTFAGTKDPTEVPKSETHLTANLGGNLAVGNSESFSLGAGLAFTHKWKANQIGLIGAAGLGYGAVDANADGFLSGAERCLGVKGNPCQPTTEMFSLEGRYDRFFSERSSLYLLVGGLHDKFAGFQLRSHVQAGYAFHILDTERDKLKTEIGVDFANEAYVEGVVPSSTKLLAAQVAAVYSHSFNENVGFSDSLTIYEPMLTQPDGSPFAPHFTDLRITNIATINAKISNKFSITLADTLAWRMEPVAAPEGVNEKRSPVDNSLTVALVASIL